MDGGAFDQDGVKNGIIVDPIYFGVASTLAATGGNTQRILMIGCSMVLLGVILPATIFCTEEEESTLRSKQDDVMKLAESLFTWMCCVHK